MLRMMGSCPKSPRRRSLRQATALLPAPRALQSQRSTSSSLRQSPQRTRQLTAARQMAGLLMMTAGQCDVMPSRESCSNLLTPGFNCYRLITSPIHQHAANALANAPQDDEENWEPLDGSAPAAADEAAAQPSDFQQQPKAAVPSSTVSEQGSTVAAAPQESVASADGDTSAAALQAAQQASPTLLG